MTDATRPSAEIAALAGAYRRLVVRRVLATGLIGFVLALSFIGDMTVGPSGMSVADILAALIAPAGGEPAHTAIVWQVRLPFALMAVLVGAALSLAGAEMQTILDNPMASPFTLGLASAATLGAALAIVFGLSIPGIPGGWVISVNAFLFAFLAALLLQGLWRIGRSRDTLVLIGMALFFAFNSLVVVSQFVASEQALQQLVFWTMGSLARSTWDKIAVLALILAVVAPLSFASAWKLTALRLGDERARSLGIRVDRLRLASLARISLLTGAAVAFVGTIGFIGLIGPHIARMIVGEDHRILLPASLLTGATLMSLASIASKAVVPGVFLPIGVVTALIGIPFFLALVLTKGGR